MEPLILAALLGVGLVAMLASPNVRGLLRAIFRRPRETSVFVEVDGKRVEVMRQSVHLEGRALRRAMRGAERRHLARVQKRRRDRARKDGAQAVTGGESDE